MAYKTTKNLKNLGGTREKLLKMSGVRFDGQASTLLRCVIGPVLGDDVRRTPYFSFRVVLGTRTRENQLLVLPSEG